MKCDSRVSFLAFAFASFCLGHEFKAQVAIIALVQELQMFKALVE
jgi:hypothetical protein